VSGLRLVRPADGSDLGSFLSRVVTLDAATLVRLRADGGRVTAYVRLPFGVLVSRTVDGDAEPADVTVAVADLLAAVDPSPGRSVPAEASPAAPAAPAAAAPWPTRRDLQWRAALPPGAGWQRLDQVPGDVLRALVRAGREALRAVPAGAPASAGESLLDHESLTVSGAGRTAVLPLRVIGALTRMGFLGDGGSDAVVVSASGGWVRLAGPYGSAYHHETSGLGLSIR
jgi:hypothetical protein